MTQDIRQRLDNHPAPNRKFETALNQEIGRASCWERV